MTKQWLALFLSTFPVQLAVARTDYSVCGTHIERQREERFLHRQAVRAAKAKPASRLAATPAAASYDAGNIMVVEDSGGVVAKRNFFDLDTRTVRFQPIAGKYQYDVRTGGFDTAAATGGTLLANLGDDDTTSLALPFSFTFFGATYRSVNLNSDGNLTFGEGDSASADRTLGRMTSGPPRIAPLYEDLDPSHSKAGVRVFSDPAKWTASWNSVPEYNSSGLGFSQTFQVALYPDGRIEFSYNGISTSGAVAGIAPGRLKGSTAVVDFSTDPSAGYDAAVVERFGGTDELDIVTASQKVFANHDDAYDYLVFYNNMGVTITGAIANYTPVRNSRTGMGDVPADDGEEYGSPRRLQGVMNMGTLGEYPLNPDGAVPGRSFTGDTPLTILGHEASHMFLAYVSVREPGDPNGRPMLTSDLAHWSFVFNSEASILAGNRIADRGTDGAPQFLTTATVEAYSPLDQYLMGLRQPEEVPPTFYVKSPIPASVVARGALPQVGVGFGGTRRDVTIEELIATEGRRRPDATVSQRQFRFGFVLVVPEGTTPTDDQLQQVETYRSNFEKAFAKYAAGRAGADATIRKSVRLSMWPMSGVILGKTIPATIAISKPATAAITFLLSAPKGMAEVPGTVVIPVGATQASFNVRGLLAGVEELTLTPIDPSFETMYARVQVQDSRSQQLSLQVKSGDAQAAVPDKQLPAPIQVLLADVNLVPYPGVRISASASAGGKVDTASAVTDENGIVSFRWTPGAGPSNELTLTSENGQSVTATALGMPTIATGGFLNAASFQPAVAPGSIATLFGVNLLGAKIRLGGADTTVFYSSNRQVNFLVPSGLPAGNTDLAITNAFGQSPSLKVPLQATAPGIFFDNATGNGAVIDRGQRIFEVYATGLGTATQTVTAKVGEANAQVLYSGAAPGFAGLYQVNIQVPNSVAAGTQMLTLSSGGNDSNAVKLLVK